MTKNEEATATTKPEPTPVPDGKSTLPTELADYPPPTSSGSGDTGDRQQQ